MNASYPNATRERPKAHERLVTALHALSDRDDRAALAALRASLQGPQRAVLAYRLVMPHIPRGSGRDYEDACVFLAGLFGLHPSPEPGRPLGAALRRVADSRTGGGVERRFQALLGATGDQLRGHLVALVRLLRSHGAPLDYLRLFQDIRHWEHPDAWVQRRLARDFWGVAPHTDSRASDATETPS